MIGWCELHTQSATESFSDNPRKHRRPNATRLARRRREVVAELNAEFGRKLTGSDRHLIEAAADLVIQRVAMSAASIRGGPIDSGTLLKILGLLNRALATLRGKSRKPQTSGPTLADHIAAKRSAKAAERPSSEAE